MVQRLSQALIPISFYSSRAYTDLHAFRYAKYQFTLIYSEQTNEL